MIGTIERIKNNVLLKCSTLNDEVISKSLSNVLETRIYRFVEELVSMVTDLNLDEIELREKVNGIISNLITRKIKRKLFIDSLALQITNDGFIEDYLNEQITMEKLKKTYIKDLEKNKNSNQLNMTEDLNLTEIINELENYIKKEIISKIEENNALANAVSSLIESFKTSMEKDLQVMIDDTNKKYLDILIEELNIVVEETKEEIEEGEEDMMEEKEVSIAEKNHKFDNYDDMTLFNKVILSLNTEEEKLTRKEHKLAEGKKEVEEKLAATNKNIEANIERENKLSQRRLELNSREITLNSKLSEAEVIFLNMKPLIKGLSKISKVEGNGGSENE